MSGAVRSSCSPSPLVGAAADSRQVYETIASPNADAGPTAAEPRRDRSPPSWPQDQRGRGSMASEADYALFETTHELVCLAYRRDRTSPTLREDGATTVGRTAGRTVRSCPPVKNAHPDDAGTRRTWAPRHVWVHHEGGAAARSVRHRAFARLPPGRSCSSWRVGRICRHYSTGVRRTIGMTRPDVSGYSPNCGRAST